MSGFSPHWLALREPADDAARAPELLRRATGALGAASHVTIVDLGAGAAANLRALYTALPARQSWRLVDWDDALLDAARGRLAAWADRARMDGACLRLEKDGRDIDVRFEKADLARDVASVLAEPADLVTGAAFFDLVSAHWIEDFCAALARRRLSLYATLIYDGEETWTPPHAADAKVLAAFHAHQAQDKGFGPAAGPYAAAHLARMLEERGYKVETASSPWRLGSAQQSLIEALARGAASAVAETGLVTPEERADWLDARVHAQGCVIGHKDVFATPA